GPIRATPRRGRLTAGVGRGALARVDPCSSPPIHPQENRMPKARRLPRAVALTATAVLCTLAAAPGSPAGGSEPPRRDRGLFLTMSGAGDTWIRGVRLTCPDTRGTHPHAADACHVLTEADGDLDKLAGDPRPCTKQYDPVTV